MKNSILKTGIILFPAFLYTTCTTPMKNKENTSPLGYDKSLMDTSASPCENFYQYAAGGWLAANPIPSTESRWGTFNVLDKQNNSKIRKLLEDPLKEKPTKGSPEQLTRDFYQSAMDSSTREKLGVTPLNPFFQQIDALKTKEDISSLLGDFNKKGLFGLFSFYISTDAKNSEYYAVYMGQGGLGLPDRDYYLKEDAHSQEIRTAYKAFIAKILNLAGQSKTEVTADKIMSMETQLAQISMTKTEMRDPDKTYNKKTYAEFVKLYSYFNWDQFFANAGAKGINELVVSQTDFFAKLKEVFAKYSLEEWQSYLKWHIARGFAGYLNHDMVQASFNFYQTTLRGTKEMKPLWERSVNMVNGNLGEPLGQMFVKAYFSPESKKRVSEMVEELRTSFGERIQKLDWMSAETKVKAMEKLKSFGYKIGYPEKWKDYSMVEISTTNLVQNLVNVNLRETEIMLAKIGQQIDKTEWEMTPQTVNAYYEPTRNEIVFPAGILQAPFFDPNVDDALNYGGIGAVIGHEFSHGFDDEGSKYDGKGNLSNWWTDKDNELFRQRTNKIVEQFNKFEVLDSVFINGELTQGENIADFAGLTIAYYALKNHIEKQGKQLSSPDGFTWQQRFFMGWALVWANNITDKELRQRVITDPHSPGKYRVLGPLSNMPEFQKAFGCKPGSKMHADDDNRVIIW